MSDPSTPETLPAPIFRLVYLSHNTMDSAPGEMQPQIDQILASSRRNNPAVGVTGALMFNRGCFGQILEGAEDAVKAVFDRILLDPRHDGVEMLSSGTVEERVFPDWAMDYVGSDQASLAAYGHLSADERLLEGEDLLRLLVNTWEPTPAR